MKKKFFIPSTALRACFLLSTFIFSCAPATPSTPQVVDVYATASASPWLDELYACADDASVTLNLTSDSPQITLRLGQPDGWAGSVFQIGSDDILVAANLQSPLPSLTLEQARTLFAGQGNPSAQVWAYASAEDTQRVFEQAVMNGRNVISFARLAVSPSHMSEVLSADANVVGILPRRWMTDRLRELFLAATVPVLALTPSEPAGSVRDLIACMQKDD